MAWFRQFVGLLTTSQSSEQGTDRQQTNDKTLDASFEPACSSISWYAALCEAGQEIFHEQNVRDLTSVIAEKESSCVIIREESGQRATIDVVPSHLQ